MGEMYRIVENDMVNAYKAKSKWEAKLIVKFTTEDWKNISINSQNNKHYDFWKEYAWKIQYFITSILQEKMYQSGKSDCLRKCGEVKAHNSHIYYLCSKLKQFWSIIISIMKDLFDVDSSTHPHSILLGLWPPKMMESVISCMDPEN